MIDIQDLEDFSLGLVKVVCTDGWWNDIKGYTLKTFQNGDPFLNK